MDQKPIVLYLRMKGMDLESIYDDLVRTLGKDAVAYSTVTKYARSAQFPGRQEANPPEAPDVERSPVDEAIFMAFAKFPFSSVRKLSRRICLPRSTVHRAPCTGTGTSRNHFAHSAISSMDPPLFDGGAEADSSPDGNRTIAGPLGAKHAPVARHCHLGRVMDLFVQ
jgi:hypothetical protein